MKPLKTMFLGLDLAVLSTSCEKDEHVPSYLSLKTSSMYTSADAMVEKFAPVTVGFVADKIEAKLKPFTLYAFNNATTTTSDTMFILNGTEQNHYDIDYLFTTRNTAGTEKWTFTITNPDGNIAQKQLTVQ